MQMSLNLSKRPGGLKVMFLTVVMLALSATWAQAASAAGAPAADTFSWKAFLAPFHTVVLHLPIGFLTIAFILELYSLWRPLEAVKKVISIVLVMTVITAIISVALGLLRGESADYDPAMLDKHKWAGITFATMAFLTMAFHFGIHKSKLMRGVYWLFLFCSMGVMTVAGHLGGNLTHGSAYLTENAPPFIKNLIGEKAPEVAAVPTDDAAKYYVDEIKPIFEAKCFSCHGPEKQKGGMRLDERASVLKGGDSEEPTIKPGDPASSYLLKVVMLPADHDDVMPPSGKGTVSEEEIAKMVKWIRNGAAYPAAAPTTQTAEKKQDKHS